MPSRTRQPKAPAAATAPAEKRGRGRPPKAFEDLSESGKAKRLERQQRATPKEERPAALKAVPPAPPAPAAEAEIPDDDLPPFAIREEIGVEEFMRRAMLGLINPTARQMIAARALMAMQPKPPAAPAGQGGGELGKKEQRAGAAQVVAGGSKYNPEPPPSRLRAV